MEIADALYGVTMRGDGITDGDLAAPARPGVGRQHTGHGCRSAGSVPAQCSQVGLHPIRAGRRAAHR